MHYFSTLIYSLGPFSLDFIVMLCNIHTNWMKDKIDIITLDPDIYICATLFKFFVFKYRCSLQRQLCYMHYWNLFSWKNTTHLYKNLASIHVHIVHAHSKFQKTFVPYLNSIQMQKLRTIFFKIISYRWLNY